FNASLDKDNIALVRLATPLKFNNQVQQVKYSAAIVPDNATLTVTGLASTPDCDVTKITNEQQILDVQPVALDRCRAAYAKAIANHSLSISEANLCTTTRKKRQGTCPSDSGSPLIWEGQQVGIVSRSVANKPLEYPDIATRISFYYNWIQKTIAANSD
uniref:Peptidase S1 domain-containing protein n=1 Tax=Anopheles maculatus TaxID=74869 RepID=A0A182T1H3_9DIPT